MKTLIATIPLFFHLNIRFNSDENLLICTLKNKHKQEVYFKHIFDYYRYDNYNHEESFLTLVVGNGDREIRFAGDTAANRDQYLKLEKGMPAMYFTIMLDKFSKIYYDKANPINHINGDCCLSFTNKKKISRLAVPIPLAPKDSFQFCIPVDKRLWKSSSYEYPDRFTVGKDSLFLFLVAEIPVSTKKTHSTRFYKNQVVTSDTIWFVPK